MCSTFVSGLEHCIQPNYDSTLVAIESFVKLKWAVAVKSVGI